MTINIHDIIIDRSPKDKALRLETLRAELVKEGYTIVATAWLDKLNAAILKRNFSNGDQA
jgi:hypothetical protein